jgi:hypothetical protein
MKRGSRKEKGCRGKEMNRVEKRGNGKMGKKKNT